MPVDGDDDLRGYPMDEDRDLAGEQMAEGEAVTQGTDVHDIGREGMPHGLDVVTDAEQAGIDEHGRTVIDRSHEVETRGVNVIDLGPAAGEEDEPRLP